MVNKKPKTVLYRRKREGKTDYKKRLKQLLAKKLRVVVRISNHHISAQLIKFTITGDHVLVGIDSTSLKKMGWEYSYKNTPAAYLTGLLFGKIALDKGYTEGILDTGMRTPIQKGKIYAFLKGIIDSGFKVPYGDKEIFPAEERIKGKHIEHFALKIKGDERASLHKFTQYLKNNVSPEKITEQFTQVKEKIMVLKKK